MRSINEENTCISDIAGRFETATIASHETAAAAARQMQRKNVGLLVVVNRDGELVGVLSERDIVRKSIGAGQDPKSVTVADVMTTDVATCEPNTAAREAYRLMLSRHIRHLPIVENKRPVGMVSNRDVLTYQLKVSEGMKAAAEQTAQLIKRLKGLELRELLRVIGSEVPPMLSAAKWALWFMHERDNGREVPVIHRERCHCQKLEEIGLWADAEERSTDPPAQCAEMACDGSRYLLRLGGGQQSWMGDETGERHYGFLCMCGLPKTGDVKEVQEYRSWLLEDIVKTVLTNALMFEHARRSNMMDALTGVYSRDVLIKRMSDEHKRCLRYRRTHSFAVIDVDNFKRVNDSYGHAEGDRILRNLADILRDATRDCDVVARYGGDEFAILLPETNVDGATMALERIRARAEESLLTPGREPVTLSCGVAQWSGQADETCEKLFLRADEALYACKRAGRNTVCAYGVNVA